MKHHAGVGVFSTAVGSSVTARIAARTTASATRIQDLDTADKLSESNGGRGGACTAMRSPIVVVGGGIVGLATAYALVQDERRAVLVLEAEDRLAAHQSGHNSGVIHSGLYYRPGSLKARMCREGREALYRFCDAARIPYRRSGKLVVATRQAELPALARLEERGRANGLQDLRRLAAAELEEVEPAARGGVAGLWVPETGV